MSQENVEVVRRVVRRLIEQDVGAALEDVDPGATLDWSSSDAPDSGIYSGHAGWRAFAESRDEAFGRGAIEHTELIARSSKPGSPSSASTTSATRSAHA